MLSDRESRAVRQLLARYYCALLPTRSPAKSWLPTLAEPCRMLCCTYRHLARMGNQRYSPGEKAALHQNDRPILSLERYAAALLVPGFSSMPHDIDLTSDSLFYKYELRYAGRSDKSSFFPGQAATKPHRTFGLPHTTASCLADQRILTTPQRYGG